MWCYNFGYILCLFCLLLGLKEANCSSRSSHFGEDETCYSFAGGTVYPAGTKHAGHQLHTTKAVSKFLVHFKTFNSMLMLNLLSNLFLV